ncbi:MAG: CYTH domain-containing protein [Bacteroidales bacterium]|nr:CYTH domain-containing protein [Bacteroidales bacterium]
MALEIEHKYLVVTDDYLALCDPAKTRRITQGYLSRVPERTVRVRITEMADGSVAAFLTVKGRNAGDTRLEFEYAIPADDARHLLTLCEGHLIIKTRYIVPYAGHTWEVDIFEGAHSGLQVAEIELPQSTHNYPLPPFAGPEVTGNPRYYNSAL